MSLLPGGERAVRDAIRAHVNAGLARASGPIRERISRLTRRALADSPENLSLQSGRLRAELGVPDPQGALEAVIDGLAGNMTVRPGDLSLHVGLSRVDLSDVLGIPQAAFDSEGGHRIDWLAWLLTAGDELINLDYRFAGGPSPASRTGLGVMKRGGVWRVPPEFAGTQLGGNWISRALDGASGEFLSIILEEAGRAM